MSETGSAAGVALGSAGDRPVVSELDLLLWVTVVSVTMNVIGLGGWLLGGGAELRPRTLREGLDAGLLADHHCRRIQDVQVGQRTRRFVSSHSANGTQRRIQGRLCGPHPVSNFGCCC